MDFDDTTLWMVQSPVYFTMQHLKILHRTLPPCVSTLCLPDIIAWDKIFQVLLPPLHSCTGSNPILGSGEGLGIRRYLYHGHIDLAIQICIPIQTSSISLRVKLQTKTVTRRRKQYSMHHISWWDTAHRYEENGHPYMHIGILNWHSTNQITWTLDYD